MTYGDAIEYIVNNKCILKALRDLSECASVIIIDMQKETAELKAEKRTVKKFLECDLATDQRLYAIGTLLEEDNEQ
jgi:hypothetical protein